MLEQIIETINIHSSGVSLHNMMQCDRISHTVLLSWYHKSYLTLVRLSLIPAPDSLAGGGAPAMESRLSTLAITWDSNLTEGSQPAKLPLFGDTALKTL